MLAIVLSAGNSTYKLGKNKYETGISKVFICTHKKSFNDSELRENLLNKTIDFTHPVRPTTLNGKTYYPSERSLKARNKNLKNGITVNYEVRGTVLDLLN